MTAGNMLLEAAARVGWYGLMVRTSGPQIRGGEAAALLRFASHELNGLDDRFDFLIAIDWHNLHRFAAEIALDRDSLIVGDQAQGEVPEAYAKTGARCVDMPIKSMAKSAAGSWPNMIALGVASQLLGISAGAVKGVIESSLRKSRDSVAASLTAVDAGRSAAAQFGRDKAFAPGTRANKRWLITGNEAAGYGAVRGGVRFVAAYPITPATEMLEWLAPALAKVGGVLVQAEDELASINMAIGAAYGGVPALTATAGPGLSLMTEALGFAVAAEVPIVVIDVMRGGPSTGIPAKSEQSDICVALNGLHGDAPRIVVAPNSIADCVVTTQWATHLAESLQAPAIVLSDQFLGQARAVIDRPADISFAAGRLTASAHAPDYRRYADTESGVSPMAIPGTPGIAYTTDGLEHNERGIPSSQVEDHHGQLDKRCRKLAGANYGARWADLEGEGNIAVITLGSSTGPVREAIERAHGDGVQVRLISMRLLAPARPDDFSRALRGVTRVMVVEQNHGAQLYRYLRSVYDLPRGTRSFCRAGPLPIRPAEVHREIIEWSQV